MVATNDDIVAELKKIKKLLKGQYHYSDEADEQINKPE
jgi:hypothetical protein